MHSRFPIPPAIIAAFTLATAPAAPAKFLSPPEVIKEPELTALVDILKKAPTQEASKPAFEAAAKLAASATSPEREFFLGYLYQFGLGTTVSLEKALIAYQKSAAAGFAPARNNLGLLQLASGGDPAAAVAMVEDLANTGNAAAQTSMGQLYMDGVPAAKIAMDSTKAQVWLERAMQSGDPDAAWTLAKLIGSQPNLSEAQAKRALDLMEKTAQSGYPSALIEYGTRLVTGNAVKQDIPRGLSLLQQAADGGANGGLMALGSLYEEGNGVPNYPKKALEFFRQAIARNEFSAYNKLGYFYENGIGVEKNEEKAVEAYHAGASKNSAMCMFNIAVCHDEGKCGLKKDPATAFTWHYKAAMSGFVPSQLALATRYRDGRGVPADAQAALAWYQRAMQNGDLTGALNVAAILENGSSGVVDNKTAAGIYQEAASKGNPLAMASLGAMIEDGRGVKGDFKQVYVFYTAGAEAKIEAAQERLAKFKTRLTPQQLKEAEAFLAANRPAGGGRK